MFQESRTKRTPMQIIGLVVIFILAILIVLTFVIFGIFRNAGAAPKLFGYRVYVVNNDLMEPRIPKGAAVFVQEGTLPDPSKQSVILCNIDEGLYIIGCTGIQTTESGTSYIVRYDNVTDDRTWGISESDIVGVATNYDSTVGWIIRFASSKLGMMLVVIVPCAILILYELLMLVFAPGGGPDDREVYRKSAGVKPVEPKEATRKADSVSENDLVPEREDVHIPVDTSVGERFVEKQLRRANVKLTSTINASAAAENSEPEISLGEIDVELRRAQPDIPATSKPEPKPESEPKPEPNPEPKPEAKPAEKPFDTNELSTSRIDELIKLLEEEKKRLADK